MDGLLKAQGGDAPDSKGGDAPDNEEALPLPVLREDLEIVPTAPQANGAPAWVIFDPVAGRYFEIGRELLDMLLLWRVGTLVALIKAVRSEYGRGITQEDVEAAIHFFISNALVRDIPGNDYRMMAEKEATAKKSVWSNAMHSYLFFRIPLFRPDRFLRATYPFVKPLFSRAAVLVFLLMGIIGLYFVSRQWEHFSTTFQFMLSWQGAILYGVSLVVVKSIHELGHAYMSVRYGLRVPTIGIAFMVLMPVLYTDTSGAWRLQSRRKRLMIDGAGIFTELALAAVATLIWVFLPDGGVRLCFFAIATTSWITSLAVNLNPLMRFDGYYILADSLGFQNLQNRGFDMAKWRLRELLFGLGEPAPEQLTPRLRRLIIVHAWATWIYRFFLFLGIALLVYAFFIKIVGILLFIIEIIWFIARPVWKEMRHWWDIRSKIMSAKRILVTTAVVAALTAVAVVPWSTRVSIPGLMTAEQEQALFAPFAARVKTIALKDGQRVEKGDVLLRLDAPKLDQDVAMAQERARLLESRIDRTGSDVVDRASLIVLENELNEVREQLDGLRRVQRQLVVRAPLTGVVTDIDPELHAGLWVNPKTPLAIVQAADGVMIKGYVSEGEVFRFSKGATARFVPDNPDLPIIDAIVRSVSQAASDRLDEPYLALKYGGSVATEEAAASAQKNELRPTKAAFAVYLDPAAGHAMPGMALRGVTLIEGRAESFYTRIKRQVLKILVREVGV
ncbi:MAG: HlyD family efflux transporter periplasmic adaptor subunit [Pseudomonadota bacterium]